jgi:hypothetical protein
MTRNQWLTIRALRKMVAEGDEICREVLAAAHRIGYSHLADADSKKVAAYVNGNLKSAVFMAALKPLRPPTLGELFRKAWARESSQQQTDRGQGPVPKKPATETTA